MNAQHESLAGLSPEEQLAKMKAVAQTAGEAQPIETLGDATQVLHESRTPNDVTLLAMAQAEVLASVHHTPNAVTLAAMDEAEALEARMLEAEQAQEAIGETSQDVLSRAQPGDIREEPYDEATLLIGSNNLPPPPMQGTSLEEGVEQRRANKRKKKKKGKGNGGEGASQEGGAGLSEGALEKLKHFNEQRDQRVLQRKPQLPVLQSSDRVKALLERTVGVTQWKPTEDGADHINVSSSAKTKLGKLLNPAAATPFTHPQIGPFASIDGLRFWLIDATHNDQFRTAANGMIHKLRQEIKAFVPGTDWQEITAEAMWLRTLCYPDMMELMTANELPYRCYYMKETNGVELPVEVSMAEWLLPVLEEIGRALKARKQEKDAGVEPTTVPNFDGLLRAAKPATRGDRRPESERRRDDRRGDRPAEHKRVARPQGQQRKAEARRT